MQTVMIDLDDLENQLQKALRECPSLKEENERLKNLLGLHPQDIIVLKGGMGSKQRKTMAMYESQ